MLNTLSKHTNQSRIIRNITRAHQQTVTTLSQCYSGFILDRLGKYGAMHHEIRPLRSDMTLCGTAVTVLGADLSVRRMAIDLAQAGDILVVAAGGTKDYACFGDGTALKMQLKNMAGIVIDGATRDSGRVANLGFPTFVKGATPCNYHYPIETDHGAINVPVVCGGVLVNPGDVIFGDADGVIVIPREIAEKLASTILDDLKTETEMRQAMKHYVPFGLEDELKERGYIFE